MVVVYLYSVNVIATHLSQTAAVKKIHTTNLLHWKTDSPMSVSSSFLWETIPPVGYWFLWLSCKSAPRANSLSPLSRDFFFLTTSSGMSSIGLQLYHQEPCLKLYFQYISHQFPVLSSIKIFLPKVILKETLDCEIAALFPVKKSAAKFRIKLNAI